MLKQIMKAAAFIIFLTVAAAACTCDDCANGAACCENLSSCGVETHVEICTDIGGGSCPVVGVTEGKACCYEA
jgi:hypothetical protein